MEVIGYAIRITAHDATASLQPYITQISLILLAPVLFAASIYMTLKGIIHKVHGEKYSPVRAQWLSKLFVAGDVLSLLIQCSGSAIMVNPSQTQLGQNIVVAGLLVQIIIFGLFWVTALVFHKRMRRQSLGGSLPADVRGSERTLYMLYGVSALIMLRSVFRVVEFVMGNDGYLLSHEWTLYVFDSAPMLIVMAVFCWRFPATNKVSSSVYSASSFVNLSPREVDVERKGTH